MRLYHISKDVSHRGHFSPRIPDNRGEDEDATIGRISFSSSIEGCFTGMPGGGGLLDETNLEQRGIYKLFVVDVASIDPSHLITPEKLYQNGWVSDAMETREHWVTCPLTLGDGTLIHLSDCREEWVDTLTAEERRLLEKAEEEGDDETISELLDGACGITLIRSIVYTDLSHVQRTITFNVDCGTEAKELVAYLGDFPVTVEEGLHEVRVTPDEPIDLAGVCQLLSPIYW